MKSVNEIAVLVQARLGSQRCPNKMIRPFAGTTLTDITIEKLTRSEVIPKENIYLAVYEPELIEIGKKYDVNIFKRSEESAKSEGDSMQTLYEWWDKLPFKYVVMVNACTPFLTISTIDDFFSRYMNSDSDGMFGVVEKKNYFWDEEGNCFTPPTAAVMNTKTAKNIYEAAHCLYASSLASIGVGTWMGDFRKKGDIALAPVPEAEVFDVDYEWEFTMYEALYKQLHGVKR